MFKIILFLLAGSATACCFAAPFTTCPSKAFLIQETSAKIFGVNLVSGGTTILSDNLGTTNKINALGFNLHDHYLYGWGYEDNTIVRIGDDFQIEPLVIQNRPNSSFYVGDVSVLDNTYYMYHRSNGLGLFAVELDENSSDYLVARKVVDSSQLNLVIFDLAFHPNNGLAYSVDRNGFLHQIDVSNGESSTLGNVGQAGTFGAVYFDVEGNFYISRNSDGIVFRIELDRSDLVAVPFANGPASSNNDGARCATAPIIDEDAANIDFGDAPDSYGSSLSANGARHELVDQGLFLGTLIDGESNSAIFPASDELTGLKDEDGIEFVTSIERGLDAVIQVTASQSGYLNAWLDTNLNGVFDSDENIISDRLLEIGSNKLVFSVPANAQNGNSWMRFRLSNETNLGPNGGTVDGEVEDYPVAILGSGVTSEFYPSSSGWSTIAFEDKWPVMGDYDSNDVVVHLRTIIHSHEGTLKQVTVEGLLVAIGGSFHNGFAVHLPGIKREQVNQLATTLSINNVVQLNSGLEAERDEAIFILASDLWDLVDVPSNCTFFRTEKGCEDSSKVSFRFTIPFNDAVARPDNLVGIFDPFIFATPGTYHGELVGDAGRAWELHQKNVAPTSAFDWSLFGQGDDASDPSAQFFYQTQNGLPWALQMGNQWKHPVETIDLLLAYPEFEAFALSDGQQNINWYLQQKAVTSNIINR